MRQTVYESFTWTKEQFYNRYVELTTGQTGHVWLESGRIGSYTMAGIRPVGHVRTKDGITTITISGEQEQRTDAPFILIDEIRSRYASARPAGMPPFFGGLAGYVSYDAVRYLERLPEQAEDDLATADVSLYWYDEVAVFDHQTEQLFVAVTRETEAEARLDLAKEVASWRQTSPVPTFPTPEEVTVRRGRSFERADFVQAADRVKRYIEAGDVFQVNLAVRQQEPLRTTPAHIYDVLRTVNPSPYMGYFADPDLVLVSASPELLVEKIGASLATRPIAGTRPRGKDEEEDLALAKTLLDNEKERAEHVMLVDLERNDLGRVSRYGSVHVDELMVIEKYSHVQHIVSNVRGEIADGETASSVLAAMFPGGTITGAPKIRTMEIIEELEPVRRGIYTGSLGFISWADDAIFNILIRTLVAKDGMAYIQAGAGIVTDSDSESEYEESLSKAKALWVAKEMAEETT
ncbi:anthranilate synthase component I family protein [Exiguobacterium antarcticum]|uniref:Anthranilate synthase component I family protein n=1 Tax=Exiguobacterium antarcticum TaxID=132920 RepID=A0ABT6R4Y8_9BACL|nr:anthranilate synthase component I family protein [Exiguobacterium antarcticum]MDI3235870.1 anthranilate synthase component I family protein [Exiguobacterium antarcticum]